MNKKKYLVIVVLLCFLVVTGGYTLFHCSYRMETKEWFRECIKDGEYVIVGNKTESLFGDTTVQIYIFNKINAKNSFWFETQIPKRSSLLSEDDYMIEYTEEYIKLSLKGYQEQTDFACRFYYDDYK